MKANEIAGNHLKSQWPVGDWFDACGEPIH